MQYTLRVYQINDKYYLGEYLDSLTFSSGWDQFKNYWSFTDMHGRSSHYLLKTLGEAIEKLRKEGIEPSFVDWNDSLWEYGLERDKSTEEGKILERKSVFLMHLEKFMSHISNMENAYFFLEDKPQDKIIDDQEKEHKLDTFRRFSGNDNFSIRYGNLWKFVNENITEKDVYEVVDNIVGMIRDGESLVDTIISVSPFPDFIDPFSSSLLDKLRNIASEQSLDKKLSEALEKDGIVWKDQETYMKMKETMDRIEKGNMQGLIKLL